MSTAPKHLVQVTEGQNAKRRHYWVATCITCGWNNRPRPHHHEASKDANDHRYDAAHLDAHPGEAT